MRRREEFSVRHGVGRIGGVALLATALAATACGGGDDSEPVAAGPVPATATASSTTASSTAVASPTAAGTSADYPVAPAPTVDEFAGSPLIERTEWTDDPDGRRLHVYPSPAGRADNFPPALDRAWGEVLTLAPDSDTPGMYDQFKCHWEWARLVAPNKPAWNLEPWRPALGYQGTVNALCNPGGPDPAGN
ncbi:DUF2599 domain-containing protein [Nocardia sp. BMG51109]|uniref:DUF2599 domain-containing protein n=1 Tax=Nocardia sp. BMG51109 TaxID=1056816 RepID=UPI0004640E43|nr:DUF2599 domain-containing protein [Nocardia sp. BMG51109]